MADNPPYMSSYGRISHIMDNIRTAKTPDRFTNDFLKTVLDAKSSNDRPFIGLAKRIGLLNADGTPTDVYKSFRSTDTRVSKSAMAVAIRKGYQDLYVLNEYAHKLNTSDLEGLVIQLTGLEKDNRMVTNLVKTFEALKKYANFDLEPTDRSGKDSSDGKVKDLSEEEHPGTLRELGLSYQINLVLPKTDDVAVFNAIFKSLKENLLSE